MRLILESREFQVKGPRCPLSRWFAWVDSMDSFLPEWHVRLFILTAIGIEQGWFKKGAIEACMGPQQAPTPDNDTMKESTRKVNNIRDKRANTMHLCCTILMNKDYLCKAHMIMEVMAGIRLWHGLKAQAVRTTEQCKNFYIELAAGGADSFEPMYA